ncbi:endonuclease/exonuclease/phosphatase family protein [Candidatus Woesearchaeota archaeon]|jgi:endonuclease/exonuclease/phosphatase family metal-dependent hydrolase|nr:endonuclease/exonuclease/phosphatase family protein [Candidatus Woesearchaeota archaeon]MBT3537957.1 endonuclease/exonuclease/phosphatase family protein [Candidatus Woesearchaeota archaeon]MBT4697312.1 endonuclease/exonuclease/phosphatase family protein [Candidatus Woesearchaeota archaeon]MBT4717032.1 endonuclease/exonuclease/phosphatase family protein [Candidatus Woesearchaeota archaeon]MBT7105626.1 endonuclease/exonuclease/phosphatase family protein [Candidatus Woesearchaeota archaeon]
MKYLTYNVMFGMDGSTVTGQALAHLAVHGMKSPKFAEKLMGSLDHAVALALGQDPDVLCLTETLITPQLEHITERLRADGYRGIAWKASRHHASPLDIGIVLASKYMIQAIDPEISMWPQMGGGGGACAAYLHEAKTTVVGVHLALDRQMITTQLFDLRKFLREQKELDRELVVMGDFNCTLEQIYDLIDPAEFGIEGEALDTYPNNRSAFLPGMTRAIDHILVKRDANTRATYKTSTGYSDHKLLFCEVKPEEYRS